MIKRSSLASDLHRYQLDLERRPDANWGRLELPSIFVHKAVWHEAGDQMQPLLDRVHAAWTGNLLWSGGSTLKKLNGPWGGRALRLRWGKLRAPMSILPGPDGTSRIFIHQVGPRSDIYRVPAFRERLRHFHDQVWNESTKAFRIDPETAGYDQVDQLCSLATTLAPDDVVTEPVLSDDQQRLFDAMLPFPKIWRRQEAVLVLGKGPPGSGKTILAVDGARAAAESGAYAVLILVPSARLRVQFDRELRAAALNVSGAIPLGTVEGQGAITLLEAESFFAGLAALRIRGVEREHALDEWWSNLLIEPQLHSWATSHREVTTLRFRRLLDAVLEDPSGLKGNQKDALDTHDEALYKLVREFRSHARWMELARETRKASGFQLRSEIAMTAGEELGRSDAWKGNLLILVDEAQDLVPAEWVTLIEWTAARRRRDAGTRLVLLGDENQRISPTSFSWNEVKSHAATAFKVSPPPVMVVDLPGSFRLSRRLAAIAGEVFHSSVMRKGKFREVARALPESLSDHGQIRVAVISDAARHVCTLLRRFRAGSGDERLQVIMLDPPRDLVEAGETRNLDVLPARLAKGLEFQALGVVEPFGGAGDRLSYDQAAVAYTTLTRAADTLFCVMAPAEWNLVSARWTAHAIRAEELPDSLVGRRRLNKLLLETVGQVHLDQQVGIAEAKLRDALEQLPTGGSEQQAIELCARVAALARRLIDLGQIDRLGADLPGALGRHEWLGHHARGFARNSVIERDWASSAGMLMLLGEVAAADQVCRDIAPSEEYDHLRPQLRQLIDLEGGAQAAIEAIRSRAPIDPDVPGEGLLGLELVQRAVSDIDALFATFHGK